MKNNKIATLLLTGFMALVLVSCGDSGGGGSSDDATKTSTDMTINYWDGRGILSHGTENFEVVTDSTGSNIVTSTNTDVAEVVISGKDGFIITMKKLGDTTIIIKNLGDSQYNATELSLDYNVYEPLSSTKCEIISPVPDPITRAQLEYKLAVHKSRYANDRESQATYEAKCDIVNSNISGWTSM